MQIAEVERIAVDVVPFDWPFARDEASRIDAHWDAQRRLKPQLFDGRVLVSRTLEAEARELRGAAFPVAYREFLAWRDFGFPDAEVHNLFAMPALRSADGAFMLGRMSAATANAGRLYFPAGTPEPADAGADGRVDFDANILRELEEETGIGADEVELASGWTIVLAGPLVACMKIANSRETAAALRARAADFIAGQASPELDELIAVRAASDCDAAHTPPFMLRYLEAALPGA